MKLPPRWLRRIVLWPLPLLALSLALDGPQAVWQALVGFSCKAAASSLYTAGLASLVGYAVFNSLLSRYSASAVVPWVLLAPVVAMASAWLLLHHAPNAAEVGGGVLLLIGVLTALMPAVTPGLRDPPGDVGAAEPLHGSVPAEGTA